MKALGFIETYGVVCAIEAADSALKAANITLVGRQNSKGGRITVIIKGDVGAVKAAVDAGAAAASKIGKVLASHVIPRMDDEASTVLFGKSESSTNSKNPSPEPTIQEPPVQETTTPEPVSPKSEFQVTNSDSNENKNQTPSKNSGKSKNKNSQK